MAEDADLNPNQETLAEIKLDFTVDESLLIDVSPREVVLAESLLTPGLQTFVKVHSGIHTEITKNLDKFKGSEIGISIKRPILSRFGYEDSMEVKQVIYRLENRKLYNPNVEEFTLHACDQSLLNDAQTLVSRIWKCTKPSDVVSYVLQSCAGVKNLVVEDAPPARDYKAENIHPFQVVAQQGSVALAAGDDPSFIHYMTYENLGTHRFESLKTIAAAESIMTYQYNEIGTSYAHPRSIMHYEFPCDFDLLSDILNAALGPSGNQSSMVGFNPINKNFSLLGDQTQGCGLGSTILKRALSNRQTASQQNMCPDYADLYLLKRQARMGLLEKDKIALRLTVPWNPSMHAGKVIEVRLLNKDNKDINYGSGKYLIHSLIHNIKTGGFATTTMDCVSHTVSTGEV